MYKFLEKDVLEPVFLTKLVKKFEECEIPRFETLEKYYKVKNSILDNDKGDSGGEDEKSDNKMAHGFAKYISNMATSYFMGKTIKYNIDDAEYKEALQKVLKANYISSLNFEASKESSKKGISFLLLFLNEKSDLRIKNCAAEEIIPVYSPLLGEFLECAVRLCSNYDLDDKFIKQTAAVYTKDKIVTYVRTDKGKPFTLLDEELHMFDDIPIIVVWNNEEIIGDYEPHITLIDAYDKAQSNTANDMEDFSNAYLCIAGASDLMDIDSSDEVDDPVAAANKLRKSRLLFVDEQGQAEWLIKNVNDTAVENFKNRIYNNLFFLAQVPALSDESFAGNLTGVAIKYKLIGLEELAIMKQNKFEAAQKKLIKMVTEFINLLSNREYDPELVEQKYERNFINNVAELIENIKNMEGITSKKTQLEQMPNEIVSDAKEEMNQIAKEKADVEQIPYVDVNMI